MRANGTNVKTYSPSLIVFETSKYPERCVSIVDYLATDEGAELSTFGPNGVTWEDKDGKVVYKTIPDEDKKKSGAYLYSWFSVRKYI